MVRLRDRRDRFPLACSRAENEVSACHRGVSRCQSDRREGELFLFLPLPRIESRLDFENGGRVRGGFANEFKAAAAGGFLSGDAHEFVGKYLRCANKSSGKPPYSTSRSG